MKIKKNGFSCLECYCILIIISTFIYLSSFSFNTLKKNITYFNKVVIYSFLSTKRSLAKSQDKDIELTLKEGTIMHNQKKLNIDTKLALNVKKIGFKPSGSTKYSGTIFLKSTKEKLISLIVGNGKISIK